MVPHPGYKNVENGLQSQLACKLSGLIRKTTQCYDWTETGPPLMRHLHIYENVLPCVICAKRGALGCRVLVLTLSLPSHSHLLVQCPANSSHRERGFNSPLRHLHFENWAPLENRKHQKAEFMQDAARFTPGKWETLCQGRHTMFNRQI